MSPRVESAVYAMRRLGIFEQFASTPPEQPAQTETDAMERVQKRSPAIRPPPGFESVPPPEHTVPTGVNLAAADMFMTPPKQFIAKRGEATTIPEAFICPLTEKIMKDPVCTLDGMTYERVAIESWFVEKKSLQSPVTGKLLKSADVVPLPTMKSAIEDYMTRQVGVQFNSVIDFQDLKLGRQIGIGSYKTVYQGQWQGLDVAILEMRNEMNLSEINIFRYLGRHENIISFFGISRQRYLITEYAPMLGLDFVLEQRGKECAGKRVRLSHPMVLTMLKQIASGMEMIASLGIVHRDLASRNIMVMSFAFDNPASVHLKIGDFGLARKGKVLVDRDGDLPPRWTAPEVLVSHKNCSEKSDVWSFGVLCWEIIDGTGTLPFSGMKDEEKFARALIAGSTALSCPSDSSPGSDECWSLAQTCLSHKPHHRPTFKTVGRTVEEMRTESMIKSREARIRSEERERAEHDKKNVVKSAVAKAREDEQDLMRGTIVNLEDKVAALTKQLNLASWGTEGVRQRTNRSIAKRGGANDDGDPPSPSRRSKSDSNEATENICDHHKNMGHKSGHTGERSAPKNTTSRMKIVVIVFFATILCVLFLSLPTLYVMDNVTVLKQTQSYVRSGMTSLLVQARALLSTGSSSGAIIKFPVNTYAWATTHRPRLVVIKEYDPSSKKYGAQLFVSLLKTRNGPLQFGDTDTASMENKITSGDLIKREEGDLRIVHPSLVAAVNDNERIVELFENSGRDVSLAIQCMLLMAEKSVRKADRKDLVVNLKSIERILSKMSYASENSILQRWAMLTISNLCDPDTVQIVAKRGTVESIAGALKRNVQNRNIVSVGCVALGNLAYTQPIRLLIGQSGVIDSIADGMNRHLQVSEIQYRCAYAIGKIALDIRENKQAFLAHGGIRSLAFAMHTHLEDGDVQRRCIYALTQLVRNNPEAQLQVFRAGVLQLILSGMKYHANNSKVALQGCQSLYAIVHGDENLRLAALQQNALSGVALALSNFEDEAEVQQYCDLASEAIFPTLDFKRGRNILQMPTTPRGV